MQTHISKRTHVHLRAQIPRARTHTYTQACACSKTVGMHLSVGPVTRCDPCTRMRASGMQVGNAVPPPLACALGKQLRVVLEAKRRERINAALDAQW